MVEPHIIPGILVRKVWLTMNNLNPLALLRLASFLHSDRTNYT